MSGTEDDVTRMTGDPRRAIRTMALPLTLAVLIAYIQNFVDSIWCSGLGASALSATTVSGPMYWIIMDIGTGLGVGAATAVARCIGAGQRDKANSLAAQAMVLAVLVALISLVILSLVCDPVLDFMNDGTDPGLCRDYVRPYFICMIPIVMHGIMLGLIRAEGAGKKVMMLSIVSACLNLVIDPIFIYTLDMGISGAAWATCLSFIVPLLVGMYWYAKGKMYIRMDFSGPKIKFDEMKDIMYVGIPNMFGIMAISILMIPQNMLVMRTGGEAGVVLAMVPFRFVILAMMPAQGMSEAMVPVTSATQGAGDMMKTRDGFMYTIRTSAAICILLSIVLIIAADPLMHLYTYSGDMSQYHEKLVDVLRLYGFITLFAGLTDVFSGVLQSLRRPILATITLVVRESVFIGMYWYASTISMQAIYYSMFLGMMFGAVLMGMFAMYCIRNMKVPARAMSQT